MQGKQLTKVHATLSKKDTFAEWYKSIVFDLDLLKYYDVSGCYVMMPRAYKIWEHIQLFLDASFKSKGVENVYFPMLIPEGNLSRESAHLEGFTPEVAWVTQAGSSLLNCKLAIRPTSECAFYPTFSEIVKSHSDLPIKWNQWCSVLRWEFNDPTPFIRSREFLWNEGHCAFATREEANENAQGMLGVYRELYEDVLRVPTIPGEKTTGEKFAGADDTYTLETYIPDAGRSIQCATSHCLGQNFSKMFNIRYQAGGHNGQTEYAWQTSWGLTTRSIGAMIMVHSDDKGLILPSTVSEYQIVIVPVYKTSNCNQVSEFCERVIQHYKGMQFRVHYDAGNRRPGWKYNYWEERGIPLRLEIGQKEVDTSTAVVYCRGNHEFGKQKMPAFMSRGEVSELLSTHDSTIFKRAHENLNGSIMYIKNIGEIGENVHKLYTGILCGNIECEGAIKQLKIKPMCRPFDQDRFKNMANDTGNQCIVCKEVVTGENSICLFGRSF
jgi:prolyl-tRNA synthetase family I